MMQMQMQTQLTNGGIDPEDDMLGAIKIKDGLFIGDEYAAQVSTLKSDWLCFRSFASVLLQMGAANSKIQGHYERSYCFLHTVCINVACCFN